MPIDYKRYPSNWKQLRKEVLERAGNKCEVCGVENYSIVHRKYPNGYERDVKIILSVAHLDHDEDNQDVSVDRLAAMCQRCHINYDAQEKTDRNRKKYYPHLVGKPIKRRLNIDYSKFKNDENKKSL